MILEQEKSLGKFKELYYSCSEQEKLLCVDSEVSNQTLLYRFVSYYSSSKFVYRKLTIIRKIT